MFIIILFVIIQHCLAWRSYTDIGKTCQVFTQTNQIECTSANVSVADLNSQVQMICYHVDADAQSILYYDTASTTNYFIVFIFQKIIKIQLPTNCETSTIIQNTITLEQFGITVSSDSIYLFGGVDVNNQAQNQLYIINISSLISSDTVSYLQTQNDYVTSITTLLTLWDDTEELFNFTTQFPSLKKLNELKYSFNVSHSLDSSCTSGKTPGCLKSPVLHYVAECQCLYLFYGENNDQIQQQIWVYYTQQQVWEQVTSENDMITVKQNPIGSGLPGISDYVVGFFADQQYFFYNIDSKEWLNNYSNKLDLKDELTSMVTYENQTYLFNSSMMLFTEAASMTTIQQQSYGLVVCQDGYTGIDCQTSHSSCSSICFTDLLYQDICIECSGHGSCVDNVCDCDDGYTSNDCSQQSNCLNDCSSVGECINYFPNSQCRCPQEEKRGGEDCSVIFCLNDCSNFGKCTDGACACDEGSTGDDCSILNLTFIV